MIIDEESPVPAVEEPQTDSQRSHEIILNPLPLNAEYLGDPHRIREDIDSLGDDVDRKQVLILSKLNDRGSNNTLKLDNLMGQVGRPVTTREYFLNGQPEPASYDDDQTMAENIIALRNITRQNRLSLDCHSNLTIKACQDIKRLKSQINSGNSSISSPNAVPNAEIEKLKKDVAESLAKVSSLSKGNAFNTIDVESRVVVLEKESVATARKLDSVAKAVGVLKNGAGQQGLSEVNLPIGINRFDERLLKLEEQAFGQHSRNLFASTLESTIDVLSKDVNDLRKDVKLDLASSETNQWLETKQKAFLDSPAFMDRLRSEMRTFLMNYQITPRNMPQDTRKMIIQV